MHKKSKKNPIYYIKVLARSRIRGKWIGNLGGLAINMLLGGLIGGLLDEFLHQHHTCRELKAEIHQVKQRQGETRDWVFRHISQEIIKEWSKVGLPKGYDAPARWSPQPRIHT